MTIAPLYKCPECEKELVGQVPIGLIQEGELKKGYIQHVCHNPDCNYRDLVKAELQLAEDDVKDNNKEEQ